MCVCIGGMYVGILCMYVRMVCVVYIVYVGNAMHVSLSVCMCVCMYVMYAMQAMRVFLLHVTLCAKCA